MTARPHIDDAQRRARLGVRQLLAPQHRAATPEQVTRAVVALHASDPASVFLSTAARLADPAPVAAVEKALYEDATLVRMHGMRRTLFVVPAGLASTVQASTTVKVAAKERIGFTAFAATGGFDTDWLAEAEREALTALERAGQATGSQLGALVPRLREEITVSAGKPYEARQTIGTRMLRVLGMEGSIVRRRPVGGWTSGQHHWATQRPYPDRPAAEAQAELARQWLAAYGPATVEDLRWWTGWGLREVRAALAACAAVPVGLTEGEGFVLPEDTGPVTEPAPGSRCCPPWTRPRWAPGTGTGSCRTSTRANSSTVPATSARRCGPTAGSSAAGPSGPTARSPGSCSNPWAGRPSRPSGRRRPG